MRTVLLIRDDGGARAPLGGGGGAPRLERVQSRRLERRLEIQTRDAQRVDGGVALAHGGLPPF
jgi:hypothetical protein